jgi:dienelactone hydrolase
MNRFLVLTLIVPAMMIVAGPARAKIITKDIDYSAGDTPLHGVLAYDDQQTGKQPGIIIIHEWWGNDDYPKTRAQDLAKLGYVAFAADMFGKGKVTDDPKQAGEWAGQIKNNPELAKQRFEAGLEQLKSQPNVDPDKIGAIGYCFGGAVVLNAARMNEPLKGVVTFHGDLTTTTPAQQPIQSKILVCTGAADAFVPKSQVDAFEAEMKKVGADAKVISYPNAHHSFTNPNADSHHMDNIKYDATADAQSWQAMKEFFAGLFGK